MMSLSQMAGCFRTSRVLHRYLDGEADDLTAERVAEHPRSAAAAACRPGPTRRPSRPCGRAPATSTTSRCGACGPSAAPWPTPALPRVSADRKHVPDAPLAPARGRRRDRGPSPGTPDRRVAARGDPAGRDWEATRNPSTGGGSGRTGRAEGRAGRPVAPGQVRRCRRGPRVRRLPRARPVHRARHAHRRRHAAIGARLPDRDRRGAGPDPARPGLADLDHGDATDRAARVAGRDRRRLRRDGAGTAVRASRVPSPP